MPNSMVSVTGNRQLSLSAKIHAALSHTLRLPYAATTCKHATSRSTTLKSMWVRLQAETEQAKNCQFRGRNKNKMAKNEKHT